MARRIAVAATGEFGADVLERLASDHDVVQLLTRPDKPQGCGRKVAPPPAKEVAQRLGIPVEQPAGLHESVGIAAPAVVVCAYGLLIPNELLERALWLNVHPSLLPRWRGAAPVERAIMAGDEETGVSIMRLTAGWDSGPVCLAAGEPIARDDTYGSLAPRLQQLGARLLIQALDERPAYIEQDETKVTYAEKIGPEDRTLDLDRPPGENERIVRALTPHIGARIELPDGTFLGVRAAHATPDARLELVEVQPAGGRPMAYADYLRGHAPVPGVV
jgi:methionyl-tRNA formyltransferase